jgi:threonine synthase
MSHTFFSHLECSACSRHFDPKTIQTLCTQCHQPLLAVYDLDKARKNLNPSVFSSREGSLWRYRELLPVFNDANIISLGEGWSPLIHTGHLGERLGLPHLFIKEEGCNPTGSFKARGLCLAVSKGVELGIHSMAMPSAGNAGGALAAYSAKAGIEAHVFVPHDTPTVNKEELSHFGAHTYFTEGLISDAARRMNELNAGMHWFDVSTMKEPYRLEGKKTMGYELAEQFGWKLPDVIFYPTGGGTGLVGMWKAFFELEQLGWISAKKPRMVSVQAAGCAPIVRAFKEKKNRAEFWLDAKTIASGLRVPKAFADLLIMKAIYESRGTAVAIDDPEMVKTIKEVASTEGILLCPEGAACVAAIEVLLKNGFIAPSETVVIFNTGSGYKYREVLETIYTV